ncbi:SDR family NAD(P)-dependent oxidoreductase [Actinosynnema sp. NPDC050801]|uniref:SDR family NAD(P)-dependent oxidoreductase n=1 Tax=unclassified Actinosynnema TaxID=2637065 RepID=UPI0033E05C61
MSDDRIEVRFSLGDDDMVLRNHRVHGVPVLPGVIFLDVVCRVLSARGVDPARKALRDVLFTTPIAVRPGPALDVRVVVEPPSGAARPVSAQSRPAGGGEWRTHFTGTVVDADDPEPPPIDPRSLVRRASGRKDMEDLYRQARDEGIEHGRPMKASGPVHLLDGGLVACLDLDPEERERDGFHLHPAQLDASTLVAFGQAPPPGGDAFIPVHIESFRSLRPLRGPMWVRVPAIEAVAGSGDVMRNDFELYDDGGRPVAVFRGLTCKRIRHSGLITGLVGDADRAAPDLVGHLRGVVAARLGRDVAGVDVRTGFYELGLDSMAMLRISAELEELVGTKLYPTLLFEHSTVEDLAAHLGNHYAVTLPAPTTRLPAGPSPAVTAGASASPHVFRPVWVEVPGLPGVEHVGAILVVSATDEPATALTARGHRVVRVEPDRDAIARVLAGGADPTAVVVDLPPAGSAADTFATCTAVTTALVEHGRDTESRVLFVHHLDGGRERPGSAAVAAFAHTVTAETPRVRCRAVGVDRTADVADAVLAELRDGGDDTDVRHAGGRFARRLAPHSPTGTPLADGAVCLVTGAAGGVGARLAEHLAGRHRARLVLSGRGPAPDDLVERCRALGAEAVYVRADVTVRDEVEALVAHARDRFGTVDAVFHCAGVVRDGLHFRKQPADSAAVLAPKLTGTANLDAATADLRPRLVLFSSLSSVVPNPGQADYAFANAFLNAFAAARGDAVSIAWPYWADGGMRSTDDALARAAAEGQHPLPADTAFDLLDHAYGDGPVLVAVHSERPLRAAAVTRLIAPTAVPSPATADAPSNATATTAATATAAADANAAVATTATATATAVADADGDGDGDVAIIGLAGRYPGAADPDEFWANLLAGRDSVTEVPADRWEHPDGRWWGGFVDGVDRFDRAFFGISRRDAERMDPQERLFLTTAWQALENAGHPPSALRGRRVGVFVGVMWNHYQLITDPDGVAPAALHASVANRVSYAFGLEGPSMAVDTACSSSLTALHLAVESIRRGESGLAIAGGVNVVVHPQKYLQLAQGQWLSGDGRCRAFGEGGDGYVPGEGVGAVLLKPLRAALADGDHVHAVIRSTRLNHGGRTSGFTVPSPTAQAAVVGDAVRASGVDPRHIGYVEAHGTGTSLGDPIELAGLRRAFAAFDGGGSAGPWRCAIGSVKSNIGHLESAAGIAALTKVVAQLRHGVLVPSLHAERLNPQLDFAGSPFEVQREVRDWPRPAGGRRTAGVSAFGAGGSNAHVVVEEAPDVSRAEPVGGSTLFVLSAKDDEALREQARSLHAHLEPSAGGGREVVAAYLGVPVSALSGAETLGDLGFDAAGLAALRSQVEGDPDLWSTVDELVAGGAVRLDDVAYTSRVGREPMRRRVAVVVDSVAGLRAALDRVARGDEPEPGEYRGVADAETTGDWVAEFDAGRLHEVARAWVAGAEVDWARCAVPPGPGRPRRIPLPGHPLREERCWVGGWRSSSASRAPAATAEPSGRGVELRVLDGGVALVRLLSPTFDAEQVRLLGARFDRIAEDPAVKAVVVTGDGPVFCMGADHAALADLAGGRSRFTDQSFLYEGMPRCDLPVITAMQGHAAGGGLAFGLYGDLVVMSAEASYRANFVNYGITPGMGATYVLERRFGAAVAAELMLTGRPMTGAELERRGAAVRVAPGAEVLSVALDLARGIAAKPERAVRALKRELARRVLDALPAVVDREVRLHDELVGEQVSERVRDHADRMHPTPPGHASQPAALPEPAAAPEPATPPESAALPEPAAPPGSSAPPEPAVLPEPAAPHVSAARSEPAERRGTTSPAEPARSPAADVAPRLDHDEASGAVTAALCAVLYLDESEVDRSLTFAEMGLDSIGAVELVRGLNTRFGTNLDAVAVYDHPTVGSLAEAVVSDAAEHARLVESATAAAPQPEPPARETTLQTTLQETTPRHATPAARTVPRLTLSVPADRRREPAPADAEPEPAPTPVHRPHDIAVIGMSGRFPGAPDLTTFWRNLVEGRGEITDVPASRWDVDPWYDPDRNAHDRTDSRWAAMLDRVDEFDAPFFHLSPVEAEAMDPQQRLFLQEAWKCLEDAGYGGDRTPDRCGVFAGCGAGDYDHLLAEAGRGDTAHAFLGLSPSILPARIAYLLDLRGPTMAVDTACSSSLTAVHLACESIRRGECETALAGGVALMLTPRLHIRSSNAGMLSPTGRSVPFTADADGIVLGEGVGVVLLKRLDAALRDGDHVRAVIRAGGINGDGRTNGITAPNAASQAELIRSVHEAAGVTPAEVGYVEAHGTGTPLGDPIEVKALHRVFGRDPARAGRTVLGSVKGLIGHTTMAAGVASLLKVVLALEHGTLPPSPWFDAPNPEIDFTDSPFRLIAEAEPWRGARRVAAVSSFGFSGTNCHVVVESAPGQEPGRPRPARQAVVVLSGRTDEALHRRVDDLVAALDGPVDLADVAFTLAVGRKHLGRRLAVVASDVDDLRAKLTAVRRGESPPGCYRGTTAAGTRDDLAGDDLTSDDLTSDDLTSDDLTGDDLTRAAASYAAGDDVDWSAHLPTGRRVPLPTYPFERRSHWPVGAPAPEAHPLAGTITPDHWVVADHRVAGVPVLPGTAGVDLAVDAVLRAGHELPVRLRGVRWLRPFVVDGPRRARVEVSGDGFTLDAGDGEPTAVQGSIGPTPPPVPALAPDEIARALPNMRDGADLYAAFTAAGLTYGPAFRLIRSVRHDHDTAVADLAAPRPRQGFTVHPALLDAALQTVAVLATGDDGPSLPYAVDHVDVLGPVSGPARSIARRRGAVFDVDLVDPDGTVRVRVRGLALRPYRDPLAGSVRVPDWREAPVATTASHRGTAVVVHAGTGSDVAEALARALPGARLVAAGQSVDPDCDELCFVADPAAAARPDGRSRNVEALFPLLRDLARAKRGGRPLALRVVTRGAVAVPGDRSGPDPDQAALLGLLGSVSAEWPDWSVSLIDFDAVDVARVRAEPGTDHVVAWRDGVRRVRVFRPLPVRPGRPYREGGVYLVVGGAGGLGRALTRHLVRTVSARVAWIGRSADVEVPEGVEYFRADVTDPVALADAVAAVRGRFGVLTGVVHAAMVLRDRTVANLDDDTFRQVFAPKAAGTAALFAAVRDDPLDFLVFFSSAAAVVRSPGQGAYAAGSAYQDAFALAARADFPVSTVDWGYWGSVGAVADDEHRARLAALGVGSIEPAEGMAVLDALLAARVRQALVVKASPRWWAALDDTAPAAPHDARPRAGTVRDYVREVFADVLKHREEDLDDTVTFDLFGVDSLISRQIVTRLERDLGDLPATLLFQHLTIEDLAGHLSREHGDRLAAVLADRTPRPAAVTGTASARPTSAGTGAEAARPISAETEAEIDAARPIEADTGVARSAVSGPGVARSIAAGASAARPLAAGVPGAQGVAARVEPRPERPSGDIAVVGVTGRYPGAPDVRAFWRNLAAGVVSVTEVPADRWDWRPTYDAAPGVPQRTPSRWGAFLDGVDLFDPAFFSILGRDAVAMDPQERLFLETAWNLLEETGYLGEHTCEPETGVFVGAMYGTYGQLGATRWADGELSGAHSSRWSIANRVSYFLDLSGPSFAVDSACSSSLTAVHLACESIRRGECRMAIAGGVNLVLHPAHHVSLSALNMLSPDGLCKVFDESADGFVPGEGVGAVLLKPLERAIADRDDIWGVVLASAVNAGGRTAGYTVPNPNAQAALISDALRRADVDPATIGYVEAHGTGTAMGDPIEVAALTEALGAGGPRGIGSVKSNIGHLEGAAGIAGLTKVLLQLRAGQLAPTANLERLNPRIDFGRSGLAPVRELREWTGSPRRAGISSFGAGGANAHVVVQEHVAAPDPGAPIDGPALFLLSAHSAERLRAYARLVADHVAGVPRLAGLAHTSQVGRRHLAERLAVTASDTAELADLLRRFADGSPAPGVVTGTAVPGEPIDRPEDLTSAELARRWVSGARTDWRRLWPEPAPRRVPFPTYPFERRRFWLDTPAPTATVDYLEPVWREVEPGPRGDVREVAVVGDPDARRAVAEAFRAAGARVTEVADVHSLVTGPAPDTLVVLCPVADDPAFPDAGTAARAVGTLLSGATAVLGRDKRVPLRLVVAHRDDEPQHTALGGVLKTLALEHSAVRAVRLVVTPGGPWADLLVREAEHAALGVTEVRYRDGAREVRELTALPAALPADVRLPVRPGHTYLVTGGLGALGRRFADLLADQAPVNLVLVGRSPGDDAAVSRLWRGGGTAWYRRTDLGSPSDVDGLIADVRARYGALHGIVHAAGVTRDSRAVRKTPEEVADVLAAKVTASLLLDQATRDEPLEFFVVFASLVGETGNVGQADYAYANAFQLDFAPTRERLRAQGRRRGRTAAIGWPLWAEGGMTVDEATGQLFARRWSMAPMRSSVGERVFAAVLDGTASRYLVVERTTGAPAPEVPPAASAGALPAEALPAGELRDAVERELRELAAEFLLVPPAEVDVTAELMDLGFDSIALTGAVARLNQRYGLDLLITVLFEHPTLADVADHLVTEHGGAVATAHPAPPGSPAPTAVAVAAEVEHPGGTSGTRVAVIGMAGRMPGSDDLDGFWRDLAAGRDLIGPAPADRADLLGDHRGGFLDRVAEFDPEFFAMSPNEARLVDPQHRLFLEAVWRALEDAGYRPDEVSGRQVGVFAGVSTADYGELVVRAGGPTKAHMATGIARSILANRVSHLLDLRGPSEVVDTACSSALVAIHRAVRALRSGECELALVGAVNLNLSPGLFSVFTQSGMLSPDARCKTFDRAADGYVRGEGVGVLVLKSLDRAVADGDRVHGVVLGSAVNHAGKSPSLTAPNPRAQADVLHAAHLDAGVPPTTVSYLEAHGTGTALGDVVEVEGMRQAFARLYADHGQEPPTAPHVAIGSVKTNIGHLEAAAGIAGVVKVLLSMRHRTLPAHLNVVEPNPLLRLPGSPFRINDRTTEWPGVPGEDGEPVWRAGVSGFGFGGTNAHVVLESWHGGHRSPGRAALAPARMNPRRLWFTDPTNGVAAPAAGAPATAAPTGGARRKVVLTPLDRSAPAAREPGATPPPVLAPTRVPDDVAEVDEVVRRVVADVLGVTPQAVGDRSFTDIGLDSVFRMDVARTLNERYGVDLRGADLYEHDDVRALSGRITDRAPTDAGPRPVEVLTRFLEGALGRPLDPAHTFEENGFSSFDMLRSVSALEKHFGAQRKTLLFDRPTVAELADHLAESHGTAALLRVAPGDDTDETGETGETGDVPVVEPPADDPAVLVPRSRVAVDPSLRVLVAELDAAHGKETGLAGRDIAPVLFFGRARDGYFACSHRDRDLLVWSYVGPADRFAALADEYARFARARGLRPNLLSLLRLDELAGAPCTATPFGAVQRLEGIDSFSLDGGRRAKLRYLVRRFERTGDCRVEEYACGADARTDAALAELLDRWAAAKPMVNAYVRRVRDELVRGALPERNRVFLTYLDGTLVNAVVVARIPSEPGYLLDVEFYPDDMPLGGLEFAIVRIIGVLAGEGHRLFSFGASFGVRVVESPNASPAAEAALEELRSVGIFGRGNYQFKKKFGTDDRPLYLVQPTGPDVTPVADVILMIADPEVPSGPGPDATKQAPPANGTAAERHRAAVLRAHGHNPVRIPHHLVEFDLITDSWAERADPWVLSRTRELADRVAADRAAADGVAADRAAAGQVAADRAVTGQAADLAEWSPLPHRVLTASGRSAESLLCRAWPGPRGTVLHNSLFPTWLSTLVELGFTPAAPLPPRTGTGPFTGDLDLTALREALSRHDDVSFLALEPACNATGGSPISLANLRAAADLARAHGVPVVLDATRLLDNAVLIGEHEPEHRGRDAWDLAVEVLRLADAATFSLSKDFGVDLGGLVVTSDGELAERLDEQVLRRGREPNLSARTALATALADPASVARLVRDRVELVARLRRRLTEAGVPLVDGTSAHCVLLDVAAVPWFAGFANPVQACLAWLYRGTGTRGGPHLSGNGTTVRLAVPVGAGAAFVDEVAERMGALFADPGEVTDLVAVDGTSGGLVESAVARYHPATGVPADVREAVREGRRPRSANLDVLRAAAPATRRHLFSVPGGEVEVLTCGRGPTVLMMPPFNIGGGVFAGQFAALSDRFHLVVVHHPGVGATTGGEVSLAGVAELHRTALDRLGVSGPVHVVGSSFGGLLAQNFVLSHPDRARSLTLLCSSYRYANRVGGINRLELIAAEDVGALVAAGVDGAAERRDEHVRHLLRCESMAPHIGLRYLDVFAEEPDLLHRLPDIAVPTLVVHGRLDGIVPLKTAHLMHGAIPDARYHELTDAGHFPSVTDPRAVSDVLAGFLSGFEPVEDA